MASPSEVEAQVRFALSQLPVQNAHHEFEHICRHLTQQFICTNVLPATGPVSAGGDQGRDFETFRTYLREELGPHGAFLGLVSEGTIAFICTTQKDGLLAKLREDIKKVCTSGHPVHEIRSFTLESVPVGIRHRLENETQESYGVHLEFHDAESIANLLARPEGFGLRSDSSQFRQKFGRKPPLPMAIFQPSTRTEDVDGVRKALPPHPRRLYRSENGASRDDLQEDARGDLPYWIGLLRQLLASQNCPLISNNVRDTNL